MSYDDRDRTLALAGVFQAATLVQSLARRGSADEGALQTTLASVFVVDAPSTESVFGTGQGLSVGLRALRDRLRGSSGAADFELARYVLALTQLEVRLRRNPEVWRALGEGVAELADHGQQGPLGVDQIPALAQLYTRTLSTLRPQVLVHGEPATLKRSDIADSIRATLLAGTRAAMLWRQVGGRRWDLLFRRRIYIARAGELLDTHPTLH